MKLKNIINQLKYRKGMYLPDSDSYLSLISFLVGFGIGIEKDNKNIFDDFYVWLKKREGKEFSVTWSSYILNELCNKNEEKAFELVLDLLEDFTTEPDSSDLQSEID